VLYLQMIQHPDAKVRKQGCLTLVSIIKHSGDLASRAVEAKLFPGILIGLQDADATLRRAAACVIRDVVKHSEELAAAAAGAGALYSVLEYMTTRARGSDRLPGTLTLGFVASYSLELATQVADAGGVTALKDVLLEVGSLLHCQALCEQVVANNTYTVTFAGRRGPFASGGGMGDWADGEALQCFSRRRCSS
jgi:hypothetical protein